MPALIRGVVTKVPGTTKGTRVADSVVDFEGDPHEVAFEGTEGFAVEGFKSCRSHLTTN